MKTTRRSILLNAEPFGFGPTAAIAAIASGLREHGVVLGYIGEGHSHDLQRTSKYETNYDLSNKDLETRSRIWREAGRTYDTFMTAMDFRAADEARRAGMRVIIYDALSWYWPNLTETIKNADLYIAQDFYGVQARLASEVDCPAEIKLVPPIIKRYFGTEQRDVVLLNMGGLQNPFWQPAQAVAYAQAMVTAVRSAFPDKLLHVTTSRQIAGTLRDTDVVTYDNAKMHALLSRTKLAIMTPGLGNIYESAAYNIPTVWLPPANDSQAKQLALLREHGCCDAALNWEDLGLSLDLAATQSTILGTIADHVAELTCNAALADRYRTILHQAALKVAKQRVTKSTKLLDEFGSGGISTIIDVVLQCMNQPIATASQAQEKGVAL